MIATKELRANFSKALLKARGDRNQAEFARFLGLNSQQAYQRYEAGRIPKGDVLYRIACLLGTTMEALLLGPNAQNTQPPANAEGAQWL